MGNSKKVISALAIISIIAHAHSARDMTKSQLIEILHHLSATCSIELDATISTYHRICGSAHLTNAFAVNA